MRLTYILLLLALITMLSGCTQQSPDENITPTVKTLVIEISDSSLNPNSIELLKGETVKLAIKNVGTKPHNLEIAGLDVSTKTVQPGQTDSVTFVASQSGVFAMKCSMPDHSEDGEVVVASSDVVDIPKNSS